MVFGPPCSNVNKSMPSSRGDAEENADSFHNIILSTFQLPAAWQRSTAACRVGPYAELESHTMRHENIGVVRGCNGCTCTPQGGEKKIGPNLQRKVVSVPPGRECIPEAVQESDF